MIDKLSVSRVVNAELKDCHALVSDIEGYGTWVSDLKEVDIKNRDDAGRVTEATFRVAAMGRSASYSLAYDHSDAPSAIRWELVTGDIVKRLDGSYSFESVLDDPKQTEVLFELALELAIPLPGFVKRRAEGRIAHAALDDLQAQLEH
jgi:ribosome-associated toxin RatA of RatAB toxin-antitoxin module